MKTRHNLRLLLLLFLAGPASAGSIQKHYYAHDTVEDSQGVIAPWYKAQNGQCDWRARIAAETLKRYPWTTKDKAVAAVPEFVFSGTWKIDNDGAITVPPIGNWANGDLGQRASYILSGLVDYYRYSGDPAAIALITTQADALLDYCLTPEDHPWPKFLISVPVQGKPYGQCDPHGFIQLEIVAEVGLPLIRASQLTGNARWFEAAKHWGDLLAEKRNRDPRVPPWGRYANPRDVPWEDHATGGVAFILEFFDALIRAGYTGNDNAIVEARLAGVAYLRDVLLPQWTSADAWGRNFWDWPCPVQIENVTEFAARYMMEHHAEFPGWRSDAQNIMSLFLNRTSVSPNSNAGVYHGAWAYPESSGCCGRSLWYGSMEVSTVFAEYGVVAESEWGRELARRQMILATYDGHPTGVVEDNIDGGQIVARDWFKIAHPMALKHCMTIMAWLPEVFGAARENHIMRSTSVVTSVIYGRGKISFTTADAPANTMTVLRLAFRPKPIKNSEMKELSNGDTIVTIHHAGVTNVVIEGDDPQQQLDDDALFFSSKWEHISHVGFFGRGARVARETDAEVTHTFTGNQIRVIGSVDPIGGQADIYIDDTKQLVGIDCWNPQTRYQQVLYYNNGLTNEKHTLKIVVKGSKNPLSAGSNIYIDALQWSDATGENNFGEGGGPTDTQRMVFGYTAREGYVDREGHAWRPGTEFIIRAKDLVDSVAASWYTQPRQLQIEGTRDPELYRYGIHGKEFTTEFTVGPGAYHARLKLAETRNIEPKLRAMTVHINGEEKVARLDIAATASGEGRPRSTQRPGDAYVLWAGVSRAVDLIFNDIKPQNGVISIHFAGINGAEAIVQAIEVGPGDAGPGANPVQVDIPTTTSAPSK